MSVKKSGSYITIPVFDVSWVVNFLKQVSMRFGIFKHFLGKAFSVKNLNYHSKFQLNFCFFNCPNEGVKLEYSFHSCAFSKGSPNIQLMRILCANYLAHAFFIYLVITDLGHADLVHAIFFPD